MIAESSRIDLPESWLDRSSAPIEIDLGCHKGTFLVEMARLFPHVRFLGIERQTSRVAKCLSKIGRLGLANAFAIQSEGLGDLELPEVRIIHVSFPDPWPKRRHWNRRLVNEQFLAAAFKVLQPDGVLRIMTDDEPYFRSITEVAMASPGLAEVSWDDGREYPPTEFQKKFAEQGKPVYRLALSRSRSSA